MKVTRGEKKEIKGGSIRRKEKKIEKNGRRNGNQSSGPQL